MKPANDRRTAILKLAALASSPLFAVSASWATEVVKEIAALKPGEFTWHPERSPKGAVAVVVSIPQQRVHVYRNGIRIAVATCSTGKPGHETPTGVFTVLQKDKDHHSKTYNNAPMPNMNRLTWDGVALHAGNRFLRLQPQPAGQMRHRRQHSLRGRLVGGPYGIVDLAPVYEHVRRRGHTDPHGVLAGAEHAHLDAVADDDGFVPPACEDQHRPTRPSGGDRWPTRCRRPSPAGRACGAG